MKGLNLHNIAGNALNFINPYKDIVLIKRGKVVWGEDREPSYPDEIRLELKAKLQPANLQQLAEMGFNVQGYQFFKFFITGAATQLDRISQLGADHIECEGFIYKIVARSDWTQNGWVRLYAYKIEEIEEQEG